MKPKIPRAGGINRQKLNLLLESLGKRSKQASAQGNFLQALDLCQQAIRMAPGNPTPWIDGMVYNLKLERWDDALKFGNQAIKLNASTMALYDGLSHAWGAKRNWEEVRQWGLKALNLRLEKFKQQPPVEHDVFAALLPPPPSPETRAHNLIAFSLFGDSSKYCETAVLNAIDQPTIYPNWTCLFYVDASVPDYIVERLRKHGAEVEVIEDKALLRWPRQMWRFLAYDRPGLHRVIFRDADSVISLREARAVDEWLASDKRFHHMRDSGTHTELLLAGLWGVTGGALPPMRPLIERFLASPVSSQHFADQYFLRTMVWPYAQQSLLQHDSIFGFMDARPFPDGKAPDDFHVGYAEGSPFFNIASQQPDGTRIRWFLHEKGSNEAICYYHSVVNGGKVIANLPARYAKRLQTGDLQITMQPLES